MREKKSVTALIQKKDLNKEPGFELNDSNFKVAVKMQLFQNDIGSEFIDQYMMVQFYELEINFKDIKMEKSLESESKEIYTFTDKFYPSKLCDADYF